MVVILDRKTVARRWGRIIYPSIFTGTQERLNRALYLTERYFRAEHNIGQLKAIIAIIEYGLIVVVRLKHGGTF